MGKKAISILILFLAHFYFYAQDLIITDKGDSLNARIVKTTPKYIYFFLPESKTLIKKDVFSIKLYNKNFYQYSKAFPDVKLGLSTGFSYRTNDIDNETIIEIKKHKKNLKTGFHFTGDLLFFTKRNVALGVTYSLFKSKNQSDTIKYLDAGGNRIHGVMKDDISISFIGASIGKKIYMDYNIYTTILTSIGFINYTNKASFTEAYSITGRTAGFSLGFTVDYQLTEFMALGGGLSTFVASLTKVHINDIPEVVIPGGENLSRIDVSVGIKWYIK